MDSVGARLVAAKQNKDWAGVRSAAEELLATPDEQLPPEVQRDLHYIIGDSIISLGNPSELDLKSAIVHFQAAANPDPTIKDSRSVGYAYVQIGRLEIDRGKAGDKTSLERALAAFEQAKHFLSEETHGKELAEVFFGIASAHEALGQSNLDDLNLALLAFRSAHRLYACTDRRLNAGTVAFHMGRVCTRLFDLSGDASLLRDALTYLEQAKATYGAARHDIKREDAVRLLKEVEERIARIEAKGWPIHIRTAAKASILRWAAAPSALWQRLGAHLRPFMGPRGRKESDDLTPYTTNQVIQAIRVRELRKVFLDAWLRGHVSADHERAAYLSTFFIAPLEAEIEALRRAARRRKDKQLLYEAEQQALELEVVEFRKFLLQSDQGRSTHDRAVKLLHDHLSHNVDFVLLLRNFDLEIMKGQRLADKEHRNLEHLLEDSGAHLIHIRSLMTRRSVQTESFVKVLAQSLRVVELSDISDVTRIHISEDVCSLRVLSAEWEIVVSMLIAEAAAVVVFAQHITESLQREFDLIERLDAGEKTTVLLVEPDDLGALRAMHFSDYDEDTERLAFDVLYEVVMGRFAGGLLQMQQLHDNNRDEIIAKIRSHIELHAPGAP
jgi:hypothetical protein